MTQPSQAASAIMVEVRSTHTDVTKLHPLLALLDEAEGESPLMQLVETVAVMSVTLEHVLTLVEGLHRRLDHLGLPVASTKPSPDATH